MAFAPTTEMTEEFMKESGMKMVTLRANAQRNHVLSGSAAADEEEEEGEEEEGGVEGGGEGGGGGAGVGGGGRLVNFQSTK
jgi:hypothetical protein